MFIAVSLWGGRSMIWGKCGLFWHEECMQLIDGGPRNFRASLKKLILCRSPVYEPMDKLYYPPNYSFKKYFPNSQENWVVFFLQAYSVLDQEVGYNQGSALIVALLLRQVMNTFSKKDSFIIHFVLLNLKFLRNVFFHSECSSCTLNFFQLMHYCI